MSAVRIMTNSGAEITVEAPSFQAFQDSVHGMMIRPGDANYDNADINRIFCKALRARVPSEVLYFAIRRFMFPINCMQNWSDNFCDPPRFDSEPSKGADSEQ